MGHFQDPILFAENGEYNAMVDMTLNDL